MAKTHWKAAQQRAMVLENFDLFENFDNGNQYFIGLDFSLTSTGICVVDNNQRLLHHEAISTTARTGTTRERLKLIADRIETVFRNFPPRIIAWEDVTVSNNIQSMLDLARVSGMIFRIMTVAAKRDGYEIPYCVLANVKTLKKVAAGEGGADKDDVLDAVRERWGHDFSTDDEADAFGAAVVGSKLPLLAELFPHWRKWYQDIDDYRFLLDLLKMRYEDIVEQAEKEGIREHELEAMLNLFTGSSSQMGGSGLNHLRENDRDFYYEARKRIKRVG